MKKSYIILLILLMGILAVTGCTEPVYHIWITGVSSIYPSHPVINEAVRIWLSIDAAKKIDVQTEFHWQVDGFDEEFITQSNYLEVTFETPGPKNICVSIVTNDVKVLVNNFYFGLHVFDEEV